MGFGVEDEVVDEDEELKRALALSRQDIDVEDEEADLRRAIQLSMQGIQLPSSFPLVLIRLFPPAHSNQSFYFQSCFHQLYSKSTIISWL